jgi:hypothetical protein
MTEGLITNSGQLPGPVLWPDAATTDSITDLAPPLRLLLIDLGICPTPEDADQEGFAKAGIDVPPSVAIIEAGATEFSKASAAQFKALGGVAGIAAVVAAFWKGASVDLRLVVVGGAAFVLAAALIAIAIIVSSDVRARGLGAAAQYDARSRVADAYLRGAVTLRQPPAAGAADDHGAANAIDARTISILLGATRADGMAVTLNNGEQHTAKRLRLDGASGKIEIGCGRDEWRGIDEIVDFEAT